MSPIQIIRMLFPQVESVAFVYLEVLLNKRCDLKFHEVPTSTFLRIHNLLQRKLFEILFTEKQLNIDP